MVTGLLVVTPHGAAVGQDDLGSDQVVAEQAVKPAQQPEPAAEGEPGDPDGQTRATGDGPAMDVQHPVEVAQLDRGPDNDLFAEDSDGIHRSEVDQQTGSGGPAGEVVTAAANRHWQPGASGERQRLDHISRGPAARQRGRSDVVEPTDGGPPGCLVAGV